jgi:hypothetical protein
MRMPGFTAEMSLYNGNQRYQAITDAPHYGGIVQPAISIFDWARCLRYGCRFEFQPHYPYLKRVCGLQWMC